MVTVDADVLVRLLVADDPSQTRRSLTAFSSPAVFIAKSVLLESEWRSGTAAR